jgi:hypothetical protein
MAWPNQISVNVVIQRWFVTGVFGHLQGMNVDRTALLLALAQGNEWRV